MLQTKLLSAMQNAAQTEPDLANLAALIRKPLKLWSEWMKINNVFKQAQNERTPEEFSAFIKEVEVKTGYGSEAWRVFLDEYLSEYYLNIAAAMIFDIYQDRYFFTIVNDEMLNRMEYYFLHQSEDLESLNTLHTRVVMETQPDTADWPTVFRILEYWQIFPENSLNVTILNNEQLVEFKRWLEKEHSEHEMLRDCLLQLSIDETDALNKVFIQLRLLQWYTENTCQQTLKEELTEDVAEINALLQDLKAFAEDIPTDFWQCLGDVWREMNRVFSRIKEFGEKLPFYNILSHEIKICHYLVKVRDSASNGSCGEP